MSDFNAHEVLERAEQREHHAHGDRTTAIMAAVFAVLAALATMLAHSRSTTALIDKNNAILAQAKASDRYNYYESKRIKYHMYTGLASLGIAGENTTGLRKVAKQEETAAKPILREAQDLESARDEAQDRSEQALSAYETLEQSVTLFEVSIVFVSISALARTRWLLAGAGGVAAIGVVFFIIGILKHF